MSRLSRVFPVPPGPVIVSRRTSSRRSSARIAARSAVRPTSGVIGAGRLCGGGLTTLSGAWVCGRPPAACSKILRSSGGRSRASARSRTVSLGPVLHAAFEVADCPCADTRPLGERFLCKTGTQTKTPQQVTEEWRRGWFVSLLTLPGNGGNWLAIRHGRILRTSRPRLRLLPFFVPIIIARERSIGKVMFIGQRVCVRKLCDRLCELFVVNDAPRRYIGPRLASIQQRSHRSGRAALLREDGETQQEVAP